MKTASCKASYRKRKSHAKDDFGADRYCGQEIFAGQFTLFSYGERCGEHDAAHMSAARRTVIIQFESVAKSSVH